MFLLSWRVPGPVTRPHFLSRVLGEASFGEAHHRAQMHIFTQTSSVTLLSEKDKLNFHIWRGLKHFLGVESEQRVCVGRVDVCRWDAAATVPPPQILQHSIPRIWTTLDSRGRGLTATSFLLTNIFTDRQTLLKQEGRFFCLFTSNSDTASAWSAKHMPMSVDKTPFTWGRLPNPNRWWLIDFGNLIF